jgi:hypothetical protein
LPDAVLPVAAFFFGAGFAATFFGVPFFGAAFFGAAFFGVAFATAFFGPAFFGPAFFGTASLAAAFLRAGRTGGTADAPSSPDEANTVTVPGPGITNVSSCDGQRTRSIDPTSAVTTPSRAGPFPAERRIR